MKAVPVSISILLSAAAVSTLAAAPAQGQDAKACETARLQKKSPFSARFGRLMGAAGVAAITGQKAAATAAADAAARDVVDTSREQAQAEIATSVACAGSTAAAAASPRGNALPTPAPQQGAVSYPSQIPIPAEAKAAKLAFDAFGKVACKDCEGGYSYDSWARQAFVSELRGEYKGWEKKLGALEEGQTISWTGASANGTIRLRAREQVSGFSCKRLAYELKRGSESAHRDGLICWGKANQFAGSESWVEVY